MTNDPRFDKLAKDHWDALTEQLRSAVLEQQTPEPVKAALMDVLDLHIAWERREQVFGPAGYSHDTVHGIGCRSCNYLPSPKYVAVERWHCPTMEALRLSLAPNAGEVPAAASDQRAQQKARFEGYRAGFDVAHADHDALELIALDRGWDGELPPRDPSTLPKNPYGRQS